MLRAASLVAAARAAFDGACPNASYALPTERRVIVPAGDGAGFQAALAAISTNATALEIGGPSISNMAGLYTALPWRGVDIVNWDVATAAVRRATQIGDGDETPVFYAGDRQLGRLIVADGGALSDFEDESYDVVMAFHARAGAASRGFLAARRGHASGALERLAASDSRARLVRAGLRALRRPAAGPAGVDAGPPARRRALPLGAVGAQHLRPERAGVDDLRPRAGLRRRR